MQRPRHLVCVLGLALLAPACASNDAPKKLEGLHGFWTEYQELPRHRAMALAGDPEARWVAGASGGQASEEEAIRAAMKQCKERRKLRHMMSTCHVYALGSEIVWHQR